MENDNLSDKLSELLGDPESMARIQSMAQSLFGGNTDETPSSPVIPEKNEMDMIMRAAKMLKNDKPDERSQLLLALKPHLSQPRRERVDRAVKLLRLASLMPLLNESDIFKF